MKSHLRTTSLWILGALCLLLLAVVLYDDVADRVGGVGDRGTEGLRDESTDGRGDVRIESAAYVGTDTCAGCHGEQYRTWLGSHHDLAMQRATDDSVLGNFDGAELEHFGVVTRFFRRGEAFWVETGNAEGELDAFEISYTFGVYPLQQYLIGFSDGRYQALTVAWDSRDEAAGGQRWFHLQPDEPVPHDDPLHWTGPYFNWNSRCADCHTTGLEKNYDEENNSYATTWVEIDVGCEACHGPGSEHVRWVETPESRSGSKPAPHKGLLTPRLAAVGAWLRATDEATARHIVDADAPAAESQQLDACGGCHSRRQVITGPDDVHRLPTYHDAYSLTLPVPPLYHADGQIHDEVFVLGSFLQSRMHQRGVVCSDCHDPHSLQLKAPGNGVCAQCHNPVVFDTRSHHHHDDGSPGAQCANCHMPETTYMVVDPRRDHSLRVPRPDLSVEHGTPNACNTCHSEQTAQWAWDRVKRWLNGTGKTLPDHFSDRLASRDATAWRRLAADTAAPGIARAAALTQLAQQPSRPTLLAAGNRLRDPDPLVRRGAATVFAGVEPAQRLEHLWALVDDPVRSVRLEVARLLAPVNLASLDDEKRKTLTALFVEYEAAQQAGADLPGNQLNLGLFHLERGDERLAERAYRRALRLDPQFVPAYLNLADLERHQGDEEEARSVLERALQVAPNAAAVHHAMGLQRVRSRDYAEALDYLRRAFELEPDDAAYGYVYSVALFDTGSPDKAISVLQHLSDEHPQDIRILQTLVDFLVRRDRLDDALAHAERLLLLSDDDPRLQQWVAALRRQAATNSPPDRLR